MTEAAALGNAPDEVPLIAAESEPSDVGHLLSPTTPRRMSQS